MADGKILVVDDDERLCRFLSTLLSEQGYRVEIAHDGEEGLALIENGSPDVALIDLKMPRMNGLELIKTIKERKLDLLCIMITAHGTLDSALEATRLGVYDYIRKPCSNDQILSTVRRAFEKKRLVEETTLEE